MHKKSFPAGSRPVSPISACLLLSVTVMIVGGVIGMFVWCCSSLARVPLLLGYYGYIWYSDTPRNCGSAYDGFSKSWLVEKLSGWFPFKITISEKLKPDSMKKSDQYLFACHPHGINGEFRLFMDVKMRETFPNLASWRCLAASVVFYVPLLREISLYTHCIDAGKASATKAMKAGHSIIVVPGGEQEQMLTRFQEEIVYLRKRKGFVRLAMENNAKIVPVYTFGMSDLYIPSGFLYDFRFWLMKRFRFVICLYSGPFGLPIPFRVPLNMVFGEPISYPATDGKPSKELVDKVHEEYCQSLVRLFDEHKSAYGYASRTLVIL
mmetsp:Transcript_15331/g.24978  ORF Transcript_15331/g.24978 Transcript_15331/m.24978 type:complete len:322 (-) Transcript_15331:323-1288(-)